MWAALPACWQLSRAGRCGPGRAQPRQQLHIPRGRGAPFEGVGEGVQAAVGGQALGHVQHLGERRGQWGERQGQASGLGRGCLAVRTVACTQLSVQCVGPLPLPAHSQPREPPRCAPCCCPPSCHPVAALVHAASPGEYPRWPWSGSAHLWAGAAGSTGPSGQWGAARRDPKPRLYTLGPPPPPPLPRPLNVPPSVLTVCQRVLLARAVIGHHGCTARAGVAR